MFVAPVHIPRKQVMLSETENHSIRVAGETMREGVFFIWLVRVMFILMIIGFSYRPPGRPDNLRRDDIHCLCVIVPLWILFESWRFHTWRTSRWLTDNGNGFTIRSRSGGEERFDDEAVETYSLSMKPVLNLFFPTMIHQRVTILWIRRQKVVLESWVVSDDNGTLSR